MAEDLTAEVARELIDYDRTTGGMIWRTRDQKWFATEWFCRSWNARLAGRPALTANNKGYRTGSVLGVPRSAHRVAWLIVYGKWPKDEIDHINGDKADNRIENLRETTHADNMHNAARPKHNTSGVSGVHWHKRDKRWVARIKLNGRKHHIGGFTSFDEAVAARKEAERLHGFHPNHGRG